MLSNGNSDSHLAILNANPTPSKYNDLLHEIYTNNDPRDISLTYYTRLNDTPLTFSYAQIDQIANIYASQLQAAKLFQRIIPVILPQSPELYIALLAILKSGNVYCPILPDTSHDRIHFICQDVHAPLAFVSASANLELPCKHTIIDRSVAQHNSNFSRVDLEGEHLAYTMYTSGSTGTPKAVMISHRAAVTAIYAHDAIFEDHGKNDTFLQFANSTFDISIFEIFTAWRHGLVLVSAERSLLLNDLTEVIEVARINYLELTPSVAALLPDSSSQNMKSIKLLITIGEKITKAIIHRWAGKLINAYGPSKTSSCFIRNALTFQLRLLYMLHTL